MPSLFDSTIAQPLADRLRPQTIDEVVGQDHLLSADAPLGRMLITGKVSSFILWGPPGCGKTTIARLLAHHTDMAFEPISAVFSGVADLRKIFETAKQRRQPAGARFYGSRFFAWRRVIKRKFFPLHISPAQMPFQQIVFIFHSRYSPTYESPAAKNVYPRRLAGFPVKRSGGRRKRSEP